MTAVCETTRSFLLKSARRTKHANITEIQMVDHVLSIRAHRNQFLKGKRGARDGKRAALLMEASQLKNAAAHVLAFYIALHRMGYNGSIVPEEIAAAQVRETMGVKCAPRTFRRALKELCELGWLYKKPVPTGTKAVIDGHWKTLQINKISLTSAAKFLGVNKPMCDNTHTRPNRPAMGLVGASPEGNISPPGNASSKLINKKRRCAPIETASQQKVEQTREPVVPVKQQPVQSDAFASNRSKKERIPRKTGANCSAPRSSAPRSSAPKTYKTLRKMFLSQLYQETVEHENQDLVRHLAELHSHPQYLPLCPCVLDYDKIIFQWGDMTWKERRALLRREILPEIEAFAAPLSPPPVVDPRAPERVKAAGEAQRQAYERMRRFVTALPRRLASPDLPGHVNEQINENSWDLERVPWLLQIGKLRLQDITAGQRQTFEEIAAWATPDPKKIFFESK